MELLGKPVSQGVVIGEVLRYEPFHPEVEESPIPATEVPQALARYEQARASARAELAALEEKLKGGDPDKAKILAAHRDILLDPAMDEEIRALVKSQNASPDAAIAQVYDTYAAVLGRSKNPMMRERASDLADVKLRLLRCWAGAPERDLSSLPEPVIVVADDLFPSDTVALDRAHVLGIVTQVGGGTSHTAIIARSYEIPAVLGVAGVIECLTDGQTVILDAVEGKILTEPSEQELTAYRAKADQVAARLREEKTYLSTEPVTRDGVRLEVRLNVAAVNDRELSGAAHTDGCGLFRTEFLYLSGDRLPGEEEQFQAYQKVLAAFGSKPVVLRTMDIGGDKQLPALELPKESNPFLGIRGLRLSLDRMDLFRIQIRAALRASVHGNLKIMMPMVGALDEVRAAKMVFKEEGAALDAAGIPWDHGTELGIMVEVPSIALIADLIADEVDFVSVGTNDLTQYLCAADRMNPAVRPYYQEYHPAVFRVLNDLARTFQTAGKSVSVCGELGGDPLAIPVLAGLGIHKLSMGRSSIPAAKRVIRNLNMADAKALAQEVQGMKTAEDIRARLTAFAERATEGSNQHV